MPVASSGVTRREFLFITVGGGCGFAVSATPRATAAERPSADDLIERIDRLVLWDGRATGSTWFHPRACMIPAAGMDPTSNSGDSGRAPTGLMTMQSISGSDVFGPVHWTTTSDLGRSWTEPQAIPGLGRRRVDERVEEGVCDVVPEYHAKTDTVLAIGHNVWYERGILRNPQLPRHPVYVIRSADGHWSSPQKLAWDDPRAAQIYSCGCSQRLTLPGGDLLIPLTFGTAERKDRSVTTVRCSYDARSIRIVEEGSELRNPAGRGLLEPSVTRFNARFFMTIRAEDNRGYVAASEDGLQWSPQRAWCWEDGEPLEMSTTQQHWLPHSRRLYLVYTRKTKENARVMRWRAPLFMAGVDPDRLCLIRASERIVLPLIGDGVKNPRHVALMGNFHTTSATPYESWVTVGENRSQDGWRGDTLMAKIRWTIPNQLL